MQKSKSLLPENWKPAEVNYPPDLDQYQINEQCLTEMKRFWGLWWDDVLEENKILLHISIYKPIPGILKSWKKVSYPTNWKPCI